MSQKELGRLSKMSPAELAKYQEALIKEKEAEIKKLAAAGNLKLNESLLQSTELRAPVKDLKRLNAIPAAAPTKAELLEQVKKVAAGLKQVTPAAVVQEVQQFNAGKALAEIRGAAVMNYYKDNPRAGLLMAMEAVQKDPDDLLGLNNLAAMYNLSGMQHRAIPILKYALQRKPGNSMMMNNMGQAYLGLGDMSKATEFLEGCLSADELNPEANRSMGMIKLFNKDYEEALKYFKREMQIGQRKSSLASLAKAEHRDKLDLSALRQQKMLRERGGNRDFFEEIALSKFQLPELPASSEQTDKLLMEWRGFLNSVKAERDFWLNISVGSPGEAAVMRHRVPLYGDLVIALVEDLNKTYADLLLLMREEDAAFLAELQTQSHQKLDAVVCPVLKDPQDQLQVEAMYKKCCDLKKPIIDAFLYAYNGFVKNRVAIVMPRWKEYINALINIVQLDPSPSWQSAVYHRVYSYFSFLESVHSFAKFEYPPFECHPTRMTSKQADSILQANHDFKLECPDWLKVSIPLKVAKVSLDCEAFTVTADVYKLITVGAEKKFKTGTSTLWVSAGVDAEFAKYGKLEMTQKIYVVWDHNNEFSDIGLKGTGKVEIDHVGSVEMGYNFGLNSGFDAQPKVENSIGEQVDKVMGLIKP